MKEWLKVVAKCSQTSKCSAEEEKKKKRQNEYEQIFMSSVFLFDQLC